jgi:AcrR family transcriptional regulator
MPATVSSTVRNVKRRVADATARVQDVTRTDGRRTRWAEHRAARRLELIEAAMEAIREHGANVGMDQIARAAHTSKPVIYRYFADKADLYRAIVAQTAASLVGRILAALDGVTEPRAEIAAGVEAFLAMLEQDPELYRVAISHRSDVVDDVVRDYTGSISEIITQRLREHLTTQGRDPAAATPWGIAMVGFIRAAGDWWVDHRDAMTRDDLAAYLTALLWGGAAGVFTLGGGAAGSPVPAHLFPNANPRVDS